MKTSKFAYSLAEILVTLTIIGVIASMTIPSLQADANRRTYAAGCKKAFSTLSNALSISEQMNAPARKWSMSDANTAKDFAEYWQPYLNVTKTCSNKAGCFGDGIYYKYDKTRFTDLSDVGRVTPPFAFQTADGMNVAYDVYPDYASTSMYGVNNVEAPLIYFFVDVNGNKGPNTLGLDTFIFVRNKDGMQPAGVSQPLSNIKCGKGKDGTECAAMVIKYGDLDYDKHIQEAQTSGASADDSPVL